jgi:acyl-coenzyme A thioesterase PaaI-like protein
MKVKDEHANALGTLQGGMATTIIDFYTSLAVMTIPAGDHTVTAGVSVNLNVDFLAPIHVGQSVIIDSHCIKSGKKIAFVTCDFFEKETGKHCIRGKHTHYAIAKSDIYKDFQPEDFK